MSFSAKVVSLSSPKKEKEKVDFEKWHVIGEKWVLITQTIDRDNNTHYYLDGIEQFPPNNPKRTA